MLGIYVPFSSISSFVIVVGVIDSACIEHTPIFLGNKLVEAHSQFINKTEFGRTGFTDMHQRSYQL